MTSKKKTEIVKPINPWDQIDTKEDYVIALEKIVREMKLLYQHNTDWNREDNCAWDLTSEDVYNLIVNFESNL